MPSVSNVPGLSPRQLKELLHDSLIAPPVPGDGIFITGMPGGGKTSIVQQVSAELPMPCWVLRPIQHETVEYTGLPAVKGNAAHWLPFGDLLPTDQSWSGTIFIDEASQCDAAQQKIFGSMLDREGVAGKRIPPAAHFVLAGNRQQDRAGASRLLSHIESRCTQVELLFSLDDWQAWAIPAGVDQVVRSFASFKGGSFVSYDPSSSLNPLPRTWEKVSRALQIRPHASTAKNDPVILAVAQGLVGPGPAAEFMAFREHYHLLHGVVDQVFSDPLNAASGTLDLSVQHALAGAIATRIKERNGNLSNQELANVVIFGKRAFPRTVQAVLLLQTLATGCKQIRQVEDYRGWIADNVDAIRAWSIPA